jgi:hypothetical protein
MDAFRGEVFGHEDRLAFHRMGEGAEVVGGLRYTKHAADVRQERDIPVEWVERVISGPSLVEELGDGTVHYVAPIPEHGGRFLRVVAADAPEPDRIVTLFFDRRMRREDECDSE